MSDHKPDCAGWEDCDCFPTREVARLRSEVARLQGEVERLGRNESTLIAYAAEVGPMLETERRERDEARARLTEVGPAIFWAMAWQKYVSVWCCLSGHPARKRRSAARDRLARALSGSSQGTGG